MAALVVQPALVNQGANTNGFYPGKNVKRMRDDRGWTQAALAEKAGVEPPAISQIERGIRWGDPETLRGIADAYGVPLADLYKIHDEKGGGRPTPPELVSFLESPQGRGTTEEERALLAAIVVPGRKMTETAYTMALAMVRTTEPVDR